MGGPLGLGIFAPSRRDDRGATAVEFALVMLPLIYLLFGIIQYGFYFYAMQTGNAAVSTAVRRLSVGDCADPAQLRSFLGGRLGLASTLPASALGVTTVYLAANGATMAAPGEVGGSVSVKVSFHAVDMHFPFVPLPNGGEVTRQAFARVEDLSASPLGCS